MPLKNAVSNFLAWTEGRYPRPRDAADPNRLILPFYIQRQEMTNWCWAAVAASVVSHLEPNTFWTQVGIVGRACGYGDHEMPDSTWNHPSQIDIGLQIVRCLASAADRQIDFGSILREVRQNRPVCLQINWDEQNGHAVVITGCWLDDQHNVHYRVADPYHIADSPHFPPYRDLSERRVQKYLDTGEWKKTFLVCAP